MKVAKTISGLCKNFLQRMHLDKAEEGVQFVISALKAAHGTDSDDLLIIAHQKQNLCEVHLTKINYLGEKVYDPSGRPGKYAMEARKIVENVLGDPNKANYHRARAIAMLGKTELVQKNQSTCQEMMLEA